MPIRARLIWAAIAISLIITGAGIIWGFGGILLSIGIIIATDVL